MDPSTASPYGELEGRLGYAFTQRQLLESALTHVTWLNETRTPEPAPVEPGPRRTHNERLEFLGDAVLSLAVSDALMRRFPDRPEGDLSRARAAVVKEDELARVAEQLGLGQWLFLGRGEEQGGARGRRSMLADALEAVFGAVYLDGGFGSAAAVVERLMGSRLAESDLTALRDAKSRVQELAQAHFKITPTYPSIGEHGPEHNKIFEVAVNLGPRELARGTGRSKQEAQQGAAALALPVLEAEIQSPLTPPPGVGTKRPL